MNLYEKAIINAALARNAFAKVAGNAVLTEYHELFRIQQITEKEISKARSEYEEHIIEHGCTTENSK